MFPLFGSHSHIPNLEREERHAWLIIWARFCARGINDTESVLAPQQNTTVPTYFASLHFQIAVTASGNSESQPSTEVQAGIKPQKCFLENMAVGEA